MTMDRRDFLKRTGLAAAALFATPNLFAKTWTIEVAAQEIVAKAIAFALANGAIYADARLGPCKVYGNENLTDQVPLMDAQLLGMRICTGSAWRYFLIADIEDDTLERSLQAAIARPVSSTKPATYWLSAHFCQEELLAQQSSDPALEAQLNTAHIRYAERQALPASQGNLHFIDLLIQH
jgi:hypothetical protein